LSNDSFIEGLELCLDHSRDLELHLDDTIDQEVYDLRFIGLIISVDSIDLILGFTL